MDEGHGGFHSCWRMSGSEASELGEKEMKWRSREEAGVGGGSGVFVKKGNWMGARTQVGRKGTG